MGTSTSEDLRGQTAQTDNTALNVNCSFLLSFSRKSHMIHLNIFKNNAVKSFNIKFSDYNFITSAFHKMSRFYFWCFKETMMQFPLLFLSIYTNVKWENERAMETFNMISWCYWISNNLTFSSSGYIRSVGIILELLWWPFQGLVTPVLDSLKQYAQVNNEKMRIWATAVYTHNSIM